MNHDHLTERVEAMLERMEKRSGCGVIFEVVFIFIIVLAPGSLPISKKKHL